MAMGAVLAAALTDHSARYMILTIDGVDVSGVGDPKNVGSLRYAVPIETITAVERGPGDTSSLDFVLENPSTSSVQSLLHRGASVLFAYTAGTYPIFQGFVQSWIPEHQEGWAVARTRVHCIGLEAVLDWAKVPALTIPASSDAAASVQMVAANTLNGLAFPLNITYPGTGTAIEVSGTTSATALSIPAGSTLREAIRSIYDDSNWFGISWTTLCTVDVTGMLRIFISFTLLPGDSTAPADFTPLYILNDPTAPANGNGLGVGTEAVAQNMRIETDGSGPAAVVVLGAGGVSFTMQDGTNEVGDLAIISDSNVDTTTRARNAAAAYLGQNYIKIRGSFSLDSRAPIYAMRAGGILNITDNPMSLIGRYRSTEIERTFHGSLEDWKITFGGGGAASMVGELRRLTRSTLS